jgi:hypothetical protein
MGLRGKVARSTLGDANETHDWRIYADFAQVMIGIARPLPSVVTPNPANGGHLKTGQWESNQDKP